MKKTTHTKAPTTNADRAQRTDAALVKYTDFDAPTNLIDLLTDARHWCDRYGFSFASLDRTAYEHYLAERDAQEAP